MFFVVVVRKSVGQFASHDDNVTCDMLRYDRCVMCHVAVIGSAIRRVWATGDTMRQGPDASSFCCHQRRAAVDLLQRRSDDENWDLILNKTHSHTQCIVPSTIVSLVSYRTIPYESSCVLRAQEEGRHLLAPSFLKGKCELGSQRYPNRNGV